MIAVLGHGTLCLVSVKRAKAAYVLAIAVGLLGTEIEEDARGALPSAQLKEEEDFQDTPEAMREMGADEAHKLLRRENVKGEAG